MSSDSRYKIHRESVIRIFFEYRTYGHLTMVLRELGCSSSEQRVVIRILKEVGWSPTDHGSAPPVPKGTLI